MIEVHTLKIFFAGRCPAPRRGSAPHPAGLCPGPRLGSAPDRVCSKWLLRARTLAWGQPVWLRPFF